jgi:serine/threonine protein kinase
MGVICIRYKGDNVHEVRTTLPIGAVLGGRYSVESLLGKGGSGATYLVKALHVMNAPGNLFVLKEVVEPNKQRRHRLSIEGELLRKLRHRGISRVHHVINDGKNNRVYLLMEYIEGQDLEALRQQRPEKLFSWPEAMAIIPPIIAAVGYLHAQKPPIIGGDIKPANIIMPKEDIRAVLVDFGVTKACDPGSTTAVDRYCYRAPEQYNGSIDVRTDIYALGATFYTLVTGKLPPDAPSRLKRVGNEAMDPLEPVNNLVPAIPMRIGKALDRAMSLDAQHRFPSVEQFWEALWRLKEHSAPVAGIPSVPMGPSTVPVPKSERVVGKASEKPASKPLLAGSMLNSIEERADPDATIRLPKPPPGVAMPRSDED